MMRALTIYSQNSQRATQTRRRINDFLNLPRGWHYGEGRASLPEASKVALELLDFASSRSFTRTNAFPGINGEVMLTIYEGGHYLEFTVDEGGLIDYVREENKEEVEDEENLSVEQAKQKIARLREEIWASSGLSTSSTGTMSKASSSTSPLAALVTAASPRLTLNVLTRTAVASAAIFAASTLGSLEARPPFGLYRTACSRKDITSTPPQATPETDVTET